MTAPSKNPHHYREDCMTAPWWLEVVKSKINLWTFFTDQNDTFTPFLYIMDLEEDESKITAEQVKANLTSFSFLTNIINLSEGFSSFRKS